MTKSVYFIYQKDQHDNIIDHKCKIGSSIDTADRIKSLQTGNPDKLFVYKTLDTEHFREWETFLHFIVKYKHINGEWYAISTKDVDAIHQQYQNFIQKHPPKFHNGGNITVQATDDPFLRKRKVVTDTEIEESDTKKVCKTKTVTTEVSKEFQCKICNRSFTSRKRLEQHQRNNIPCDYKCRICNKIYSPRGYYNHVKMCK